MEAMLFKAIRVAREAHKDQKRKFSQEPYIIHPGRVAARLAIYGVGKFNNVALNRMICAAWLHDVVEDTEWTKEDIEREFDSDIALMVDELTNQFKKTDHPDKNRAERKKLEHIRLKEVSPKSKVIKAIDRIDNLLDVTVTAKKKWLLRYADESQDLADKLAMPFRPVKKEHGGALPNDLHTQLLDTIAKARASCQ